MKNGQPAKLIVQNRRAFHDYTILETFEAGIVLTGTEIKAIREGKGDLRDAFARAEEGEIWLLNMHIAPYSAGNRYNHEPTRPRKLLLHKKQITQLQGQVTQKGLTLVPLKLYIRNHRAKVELALAKGKKLYDHRKSLARRDAQREAERAVSGRSDVGRVRVR